MGETNLFNQERKWSVFIEHIDIETMTGWVQNIGMTWNDIKRNFNFSGESNGFELDITEHELKTLLNSVTTNCNVFAVVDAENHFNRDQKTLNQIKENRENQLKERGITIVTHTFSSSDIKTDSKETYEARSYLKLLIDRQNELKDNISVLDNEKKKYNNTIRDLKIEFDCLQKEFDSLSERYKKSKDFIEQQDKTIQKIKDENKELFDKNNELSTEYNRIIEEFNKITNEIKKLELKKNALETWITNNNERKTKLKNEIADLEIKRDTLKIEIEGLESSIKRYIALVNNAKKLADKNN